MKCQMHPKYKGIRKPKCFCEDCWKIYQENKRKNDSSKELELDFDQDTMLFLMNEAHKRDITLNECVNIILREGLDKLEKMDDKEREDWMDNVRKRDRELTDAFRKADGAIRKLTDS